MYVHTQLFVWLLGILWLAQQTPYPSAHLPSPSLFSGLLLHPNLLLLHSQTLICVQLHSLFIAHCFVIS